MAEQVGEMPGETLAKIMLWAEIMYRLAIGQGVALPVRFADIPIASEVDAGGASYSHSLSQFFDDYSGPTGHDTIGYLLTQDTACQSLDLGRRAIGSLLHMVQDSYARGHVRQTLLNPEDVVTGTTDQFRPGAPTAITVRWRTSTATGDKTPRCTTSTTRHRAWSRWLAPWPPSTN